jgi:hypothetical protein
MYYVVTQRIIKINTGATERYAPKSGNQTRWTLSGPFDDQARAERCALRALGTHTCLSAQVYDQEGIEFLKRQRDTPFDLDKAIGRQLRLEAALFKP